MTTSSEIAHSQQIHYHELSRICVRSNYYIPPNVLQSHRLMPAMVYCTLLEPDHEYPLTPEEYGIYLCVAGSGRMILPDEWALQAGSVVICPPG